MKNRKSISFFLFFFGSERLQNAGRQQQGFFIRLGTQEITRRGMKEAEMDTIADFLQRGLSGYNLADEVTAFVDKYRTAHYSFDK